MKLSNVFGKSKRRDIGQRENGCRAPVDNSPIDSITKIFGCTFQSLIIIVRRDNRELGKSGNSVANIRKGGGVGVQCQFSKQSTAGETYFSFERTVLFTIMFRKTGGGIYTAWWSGLGKYS